MTARASPAAADGASAPAVAAPAAALQAEGLARHYRIDRGWLRAPATLKALDGVSFTLPRARTLAVVGESGSGKSTLARALVLAEPPTAGRLCIDGHDALAAVHGPAAALKALRRRVQMVFQNPYASLNPRRTVGQTLDEPLAIHTALPAAERRERVQAMLARVGLRPEHAARYPHMFSGGQRQRVAVARAMMLDPAVVVADEPTAALDLSVQAQVLNLFADLQQQHGTAHVFISHNLAVVEHLADEVLVLYAGRAVEHGAKARVMGDARHPYTQALLAAAPVLDPARRHAPPAPPRGEAPSPLSPPAGCAFHPRCPHAVARCREETPALREVAGRRVACHRVVA